jgi:plasmid stabilization system protein ParE
LAFLVENAQDMDLSRSFIDKEEHQGHDTEQHKRTVPLCRACVVCCTEDIAPQAMCSQTWKLVMPSEGYLVVIEETAEKDLMQIYRYIVDNLHSQQAATHVYQAIKAGTTSLSQSPDRCSLVRFEPHRSKGIRWLPAESHLVFFLVDEAARQIHILRILYKKRQWEKLL